MLEPSDHQPFHARARRDKRARGMRFQAARQNREQHAIESHGEEQQPGGQLRQEEENRGIGLGIGIDGGGISESGLGTDGLRGERHRFDQERDRQPGGDADGGFGQHPACHLHHASLAPDPAFGQREYMPKRQDHGQHDLGRAGARFQARQRQKHEDPEIRASTSRNPYNTDAGMAGLACINANARNATDRQTLRSSRRKAASTSRASEAGSRTGTPPGAEWC